MTLYRGERMIRDTSSVVVPFVNMVNTSGQIKNKEIVLFGYK